MMEYIPSFEGQIVVFKKIFSEFDVIAPFWGVSGCIFAVEIRDVCLSCQPYINTRPTRRCLPGRGGRGDSRRCSGVREILCVPLPVA